VCSAVAYAHGKLVVHRDIKPGNILVTCDGIPKLLDFGIVKILDQENAIASTPVTLTVQRLMTPQYASPEQMRGDTISTATDIYSLGVVLYELLTGHRPFKLSTTSIREAERIICEQEPLKPSIAISRVTDIPTANGKTRTLTPDTVSLSREGKPEKLRRRLAGDLDDIVLKALRKEPEKRYTSVEHFAADIERHLAGRPVDASRGTWTYRTQKFVMRHKTAIFATAFMFVLVSAGTYFALQNAQRAENQEAAQQVLDLLTRLYEMPNSKQTPRDEIRKILMADETKQHLKSLQDQPEELIRYADTIIQVCENFFLRDLAVEWRSMALKTRESILAPSDPELGLFYYHFAGSLHQAGRFDTAEQMLQKSMDLAGEIPEKAGEMLHLHALIAWDQGRCKKAISLFEQSLQKFRVCGPEPAIKPIETRIDFSRLLYDLGDLERASALLSQSLDQVQHLPQGEKATLVKASIYQSMGNQLRWTPRFRQAEIFIRKALLLYSRFLTETDGRLSACLNDLYNTIKYYYSEGDAKLAVSSYYWKKSKKLRETVYGENSREVAENLFDISFSLADGTAERLTSKTLQIYRNYWPEDHIRIAEVKARLGTTLCGTRKTSLEGCRCKEGEALLNEALAVQLTHLAPNHWQIGRTKYDLGICVLKQGRLDEGKALLAEGLGILSAAWGENHPDLRSFYNIAKIHCEASGFIEESRECDKYLHKPDEACFYTPHLLITDCDHTLEARAGIDFEDDHMEKVLILDHAPGTFEMAQLWIFGQPYNWIQREFHDYENLRIQVNNNPEQEIAFNGALHFSKVTEYFQWIPFEIPISWLVRGPNTFIVYIAHEDDYDENLPWEYNNLYIGIDMSHDYDRSWWFGSPSSCCLAMTYRAEDAPKPLLRSDPLLTEHREAGFKECKGELMIGLELYE
ncbi:MAG: serine/threonine-protein kinase, partial [Planctomycetota bacterium]